MASNAEKITFDDVILLTPKAPENLVTPTKSDNKTTTRSNTSLMNKHIFIFICNLDINSYRKNVGKSQDKIWNWIAVLLDW